MESGSWLVLTALPDSVEAQQAAARFFGRELSDAGTMVVTDEGSLKIDHIRTLQLELATRALESGRLVLITPGERLTLPAQQALLKLLEEPPERTTIAILAQSSSSVLPTIQSRCQIQSLGQKTLEVDVEQSFLWRVAGAPSLKDAVMLSQEFPGKRDEAVALISTELAALPQMLQTRSSTELVRVGEKALEILAALQNNVSPALCGDELCLFRFRSSEK